MEITPFTPFKLLWHRDKIEAMLAGRETTGPINLEWDLSTTCNHNCSFCSFGTSESHGYRQQTWRHFPYERAISLIPELSEAGVEAITFTGGGEPLMHPKAADIILAATRQGIKWGLVTNGFLLRDRVQELVAGFARFVRVSLDSGSDETHRKLHRPKVSQFETILENMAATIKRAAHQKRVVPLAVGASFCVTDDNWQEIGAACSRLKSIGANYIEIRPTFPTNWRGDGWGLALNNVTAARGAIEDARAVFQDKTFQIVGMVDRFDLLEKPQKQYEKCQIGPVMSVLGAEGMLWHCCVQRGMPGFDLASVLNQSFASAWKAAQAKKMADAIDVKKCPRCRYENANILLEGIQRDEFHAAFV